MFAAAVRIELRIPGVRSLKEKRQVLKSLTSTLDSKFSVSVAETGFQNQWQRSTIGVALVSGSVGQLERIIHGVRREIESRPDVELLELGVSHLEDPA